MILIINDDDDYLDERDDGDGDGDDVWLPSES